MYFNIFLFFDLDLTEILSYFSKGFLLFFQLYLFFIKCFNIFLWFNYIIYIILLYPSSHQKDSLKNNKNNYKNNKNKEIKKMFKKQKTYIIPDIIF